MRCTSRPHTRSPTSSTGPVQQQLQRASASSMSKQCTAHRHIWRCCWTLSPLWLSGNDVMRPADPAAAPSGCPCCRSVSFRLLSLLDAMLPDGLLEDSTAAGAAPNGEDSTGMGPLRPRAAVVPVLRASSSSCSPPVVARLDFGCSARCDCSEGLQRRHQDSSTCCKAEECDTSAAPCKLVNLFDTGPEVSSKVHLRRRYSRTHVTPAPCTSTAATAPASLRSRAGMLRVVHTMAAAIRSGSLHRSTA